MQKVLEINRRERRKDFEFKLQVKGFCYKGGRILAFSAAQPLEPFIFLVTIK